MWDNMDIPNIPGAAIRHFQFIVLGIWPVNLLTLAVQDHSWSWQSTPQAIMGLWEWGAFVAFSLALAAETGERCFSHWQNTAAKWPTLVRRAGR